MRTPFHESLMFSFACVPHRFLHAVFPQGKGFYPYQPIVSLSLMFTTFTRLYVSRFTASYARFLFSLSLLSWLRFATPLYRIGKGIYLQPFAPLFLRFESIQRSWSPQGERASANAPKNHNQTKSPRRAHAARKGKL